jgi:lysophospholipase L1-like esterase
MPSLTQSRLSRYALALLACGVLLAGLVPAGAAEMPVLKAGGRLAIIGDSITEQKVYSRFMEDYVTACTPELGVWCIQLGWGGETAPGFLGRMRQDLLPFKPTVATFCYGMNDGGYRAYEEGIGKRYIDAMKQIVANLKQAGAVAVVGSPGCVDMNTWRKPEDAEVYNQNLAKLGDLDRQLAQDSGMPFADLHTLMYDVMKKAKAANGPQFHVCGGDGVHPAADGQLIMAYTFLKALGVSGDIGAITVDMAGEAAATEGHKVLSSKAGAADIESRRYPFCFYGDEKSPDSAKSILPFLPFNQDLNRLTLVVKGLKAGKAKVTWGNVSKTFTREQLAKGVNLAAEFFDNPFSGAFKKVDDAVAKKQGFETFLIKEFNRAVGGIERNVADDAEAAAAIKTLRTRLLAKHDALSAAVREAVVPLKHTITVTEE